VLTFYRKDAFEIEAMYADPPMLPGAINPWIAKFSAKAVPPDAKGDLQAVKLKTRLNLHGIMSFESAYVEEVEEREEDMQVDGDAEAEAKPKKTKRIIRKKEIPFVSSASSLDSTVLEQFKEQEAQMHSSDKLVMDTEVFILDVS
jgi:heat shock protein 4